MFEHVREYTSFRNSEGNDLTAARRMANAAGTKFPPNRIAMVATPKDQTEIPRSLPAVLAEREIRMTKHGRTILSAIETDDKHLGAAVQKPNSSVALVLQYVLAPGNADESSPFLSCLAPRLSRKAWPMARNSAGYLGGLVIN